MKKNFLVIMWSCFISMSANVFAESMDDLTERDGLYYKKFTDVLFTGEVEGKEQGSIKNGKREGSWMWFHENGQLFGKGGYEDGKEEGPMVWYYDNGQLFLKGEYKDGKREGPWVKYHDNGQLEYERQYRYGKKDGSLVSFFKDGSINEDDTGTYKNGEKISD